MPTEDSLKNQLQPQIDYLMKLIEALEDRINQTEGLVAMLTQGYAEVASIVDTFVTTQGFDDPEKKKLFMKNLHESRMSMIKLINEAHDAAQSPNPAEDSGS